MYSLNLATHDILTSCERKLAQLGEFIALEDARLQRERWERSASGILDTAWARLETLRAFIGAEETRLARTARKRTTSPALAQAQRERDAAQAQQTEQAQRESSKAAQAQCKPSANRKRLFPDKVAHCVCPAQRIEYRDALGNLVERDDGAEVVRLIVRTSCADAKQRRDTRRFMSRPGIEARYLHDEPYTEDGIAGVRAAWWTVTLSIDDAERMQDMSWCIDARFQTTNEVSKCGTGQAPADSAKPIRYTEKTPDGSATRTLYLLATEHGLRSPYAILPDGTENRAALAIELVIAGIYLDKRGYPVLDAALHLGR